MNNTPTSILPTATVFVADNGLRPSPAQETRAARGQAARGLFALVAANARYWPTVAPRVREQLAHWRQSAAAIADPTLRELALKKLGEERFNVEVAATLATLAPAAHRRRVTDAIVAVQILYDYMDVLSERCDRDSDRLFAPLQAAFEEPPEESDRDALANVAPDSSYMEELANTIRLALTHLPNSETVAPFCTRIAARCAEAQTLYHSLPDVGITAASRWAALQPEHTDLGWQELLAGSCASVLGIHALIAAAADHDTTANDAQDLAELYLLIGAMAMLDSLVDLDEDIASGQTGYLHLYADSKVMASSLVDVARAVTDRARQLRNGPHHIVTLAGVVAYYASATARGDERAIAECVCRELRPLITPTLALMRAWRLAKQIRGRSAHQPSLPSVTAVDDGGPR